MALERGAEGSPPCGMLVHVPQPLNCQPCCRRGGGKDRQGYTFAAARWSVNEESERFPQPHNRCWQQRAMQARLLCTATQPKAQFVSNCLFAHPHLTYGHSSLPSGVMRPSDSGTCTVRAWCSKASVLAANGPSICCTPMHASHASLQWYSAACSGPVMQSHSHTIADSAAAMQLTRRWGQAS